MNLRDNIPLRIPFPVLVQVAVAIFFFIFPAVDGYAKTFRLVISPKVIRQGDAFVVRVTGTKSGVLPAATVAKETIQFSACGEGCFIGIGAVGIDAKPGVYPVRVTAGEMNRKINVTVRKASVQTLALSLPEGKVTLSPADLEIVKEENTMLESLFLHVSERIWEGAFRMPVDNEISTAFGTKRSMNETWTSIHRGVDIRGSEGEEVRASNTGTVVLARSLFFGGHTIIVDHGQGIHSVYMHLSKMSVNSGDVVSKGAVIGLIGSTGRATGPHLHFGVKISNVSVNPLSVLKLDL